VAPSATSASYAAPLSLSIQTHSKPSLRITSTYGSCVSVVNVHVTTTFRLPVATEWSRLRSSSSPARRNSVRVRRLSRSTWTKSRSLSR
jgi:hypothetical protein